ALGTTARLRAEAPEECLRGGHQPHHASAAVALNQVAEAGDLGPLAANLVLQLENAPVQRAAGRVAGVELAAHGRHQVNRAPARRACAASSVAKATATSA